MTNSDCSNIGEFHNIVTVLVGEEEQRFILHQDVVCAKSKFFKAACSKRWREGQEQVVRLPEVKTAVFQAYSTWIYSGEIADGTCTLTNTLTEKGAEHEHLIDLYLLGDRLDDIQLRNEANKKLFASMRKVDAVPGHGITMRVWESTMPGSLLRKMLVDMVILRFSRTLFAESVSLYHPEFLQEVAVAAVNAAPTES
jgi:hypothetical protein